jgi:hypothetical protein
MVIDPSLCLLEVETEAAGVSQRESFVESILRFLGQQAMNCACLQSPDDPKN